MDHASFFSEATLIEIGVYAIDVFAKVEYTINSYVKEF